MVSQYVLTVTVISAFGVLQFNHSASSLSCPNEIFVEEGNRQVINCSLTLTGLTDVYWYIGTSTQSIPVVQLVAGVAEVWKYEKQYYNISDDGSLIIKSVKHDQEGPYTILHYIYDDLTEQDTVFVMIKDVLIQRCPIINRCNSCEGCEIEGRSDIIQLTCSIVSTDTDIISPVWTYPNGTIIEGTITEEPVFNDSWNISISLDLQHIQCGSTILVCSGLDEVNSSVLSNATVNISSVPCVQTTIDITVLILIVAIVVAMTIAIFSIIICYGRRFKGGKQTEEATETKRLLDGKDALEKAYMENISNKPLPWSEHALEDEAMDGESMGGLNHNMYTETRLRIVMPNGDINEITSTAFFNSDDCRNMKRVVFVGEFGSGKTTIVKQASLNWSETDSDEILFFVNSKKLDFNADIAEQICKQLPEDCKYSKQDISTILQSEKCWLIFDGSDELLELRETHNSGEVTVPEYLTPFDILVKRTTNPNLRLWVTSRPSFPANYFKDYTHIYLQSFDHNQLRAYVTQMEKYYKHLRRQRPTGRGKVFKFTKDKTPLKVETMYERILSMFDGYDILNLVNENLTICILVQLFVAKETGFVNSQFTDFNFTSFEDVVKLIVKCLQLRHALVTKKVFLIDFFTNLQAQLKKEYNYGKKQIIISRPRDEIETNIGKQYVEVALACGILKLSQSCDKVQNTQTDESCRLEFRYKFLQEYFLQ